MLLTPASLFFPGFASGLLLHGSGQPGLDPIWTGLADGLLKRVRANLTQIQPETEPKENLGSSSSTRSGSGNKTIVVITDEIGLIHGELFIAKPVLAKN